MAPNYSPAAKAIQRENCRLLAVDDDDDDDDDGDDDDDNDSTEDASMLITAIHLSARIRGIQNSKSFHGPLSWKLYSISEETVGRSKYAMSLIRRQATIVGLEMGGGAWRLIATNLDAETVSERRSVLYTMDQ